MSSIRTGHIRYRQVGPLSASDIDRKILPMIARIAATAGLPATAAR